MPLSDIEIAQQAKLQRIIPLAQKLGIPEDAIDPYGHYKGKLSLEYVDSLQGKKTASSSSSPRSARRRPARVRRPRRWGSVMR